MKTVQWRPSEVRHSSRDESCWVAGKVQGGVTSERCCDGTWACKFHVHEAIVDEIVGGVDGENMGHGASIS